MSKYMLDTDMASYLIRGDHPEVIDAFRRKYQHTCISAITNAELRYGAAKRNLAALTKKVNAFCALVSCIDWNEEAAKAYARLRSTLEASGQPIGTMDMLIAASALADNAVLVTNNMAHFSRIPGLKLENWADG